MQHLLDETPEEPTTTPGRRALGIAVAVAVTALIFTLAYVLGTLAYHFRIQAGHDASLTKLLAQSPTRGQISAGLARVGITLLAEPRTRGELQQAAERWGRRRLDEVVAKGARWPGAAVFDAQDVAYFVFFDDKDVMRDFVCVRQ